MNLLACVTKRRPDVARLSLYLSGMYGYQIRAKQLMAQDCLKASKAAALILAFASLVFFAAASYFRGGLESYLLGTGSIAGLAGSAFFAFHMSRWQRLLRLLRPLDSKEMAALMTLANRSDVVRELIDHVERRQRELFLVDYLRARAVVVRETRNGSLESDRLPLEQTRSLLLAHPA